MYKVPAALLTTKAKVIAGLVVLGIIASYITYSELRVSWLKLSLEKTASDLNASTNESKRLEVEVIKLSSIANNNAIQLEVFKKDQAKIVNLLDLKRKQDIEALDKKINLIQKAKHVDPKDDGNVSNILHSTLDSLRMYSEGM